MAFQWVFDNAAEISGNNRNITAQTITRNNTVRAVSRGDAIQRFTVKLPDGMRWSDVATQIAAIDAAGMHTTETISLSNPDYTDWIINGDFTPGQTWNVICVQIPEWNIFAKDQVSWSGPFVFYETAL